MPNRSGQYSPSPFVPVSVGFAVDPSQFVPYCMSPMSPMPARVDSPLGSVCSQQNSPRSCASPLSFRPFVPCPSSLPLELESPKVLSQLNSPAGTPGTPKSPSSFRKFIPSSVAYEMDIAGSRQYCLSPITSEMEKFFSFPTMSVTFMPCVCVPDYPVEDGKPRKICRRCSVTPAGNRYDMMSLSKAIGSKYMKFCCRHYFLHCCFRNNPVLLRQYVISSCLITYI